MSGPPNISSDKTEAFIARWQGQEGGQERANYALFLTELCDVLALPHPDPADARHCIESYADFTGQGKNYTQFPDRQSFRIYLEDLRKAEVGDRLKAIWFDPHSLDPTRTAAKATREIAARLAEVSKALEAKKYPAEEVAHFLMRCLFTMFAASMKLMPEGPFRDLLDDCRKDPTKFLPLLSHPCPSLNDGEFAPSIRTKVLKFNGNLF